MSDGGEAKGSGDSVVTFRSDDVKEKDEKEEKKEKKKEKEDDKGDDCSTSYHIKAPDTFVHA